MALVTKLGEILGNLPDTLKMYYPMIETAGSDFNNVSSKAVLALEAATATFLVPNAVTYFTSNWVTNRERPETFRSGTIVYFISARIFADDGEMTGNVKAGLSHYRPFNTVLFDIQRSPSDPKTTVKVANVTDHAGTPPALSVLELTGGDDIAGDEVALCCVASIGDTSYDYHRLGFDKQTSTVADPFISFPLGGFGADTGPKELDCYAWGAYILDGKPSDAEIQSFLQYIYTEPRAGNKVPYTF